VSEESGGNGAAPNDKALRAWIKEQLQSAVRQLGELGVVESMLVEAEPTWVLPFTLLIGRVREKGRALGFDWFISGDAPITHADHTVAKTPREAARHFALQWQLRAARQGDAGEELARKAESLYEIVEDDEFWLE
jgi:hypothetical protein